MPSSDQQARLEEAFERIEETILPCIAMMLETLRDASESVAENERRFLAAELKTLAAELEELTQAVERSSPMHVEPGEYKTRAAGNWPALVLSSNMVRKTSALSLPTIRK